MFLKDFVKEDWTKQLISRDIKIMPTKFIDLRQGTRESDIIYKVKIKEKEIFIFVLLEHQSKVHYLMSFRILEYMIKIWRAYIDDVDSKSENLISTLVDFKLPPVYPIVFYEGIETWTSEIEFKKKVEGYETFKKHIPNFAYELVDLSKIGFQELADLADEISLLLTFDKIKTPEDFAKAKEIRAEIWDKLKDKLKKSKILEIMADSIRIFLNLNSASKSLVCC